MSYSHIPKPFCIPNMAININQQIEPVILIKFKYQIQFGVILRGHSGTPIDPALVLLSGKSCSTSHINIDVLLCSIKIPGHLPERR